MHYYYGPYIIVEQKSEVNFVIEAKHGRKVRRERTHVDKLKLYHEQGCNDNTEANDQDANSDDTASAIPCNNQDGQSSHTDLSSEKNASSNDQQKLNNLNRSILKKTKSKNSVNNKETLNKVTFQDEKEVINTGSEEEASQSR